MKVIDVITRVRVTTGDTTVAQFTNDQVLAWINDGIRECAVGNNLLQKTANQDSVVGTGNYTLPTDILKMHSILYDNKKIDMLNKEEFDERYSGVGLATSDRGVPSVGFIWAGILNLYPIPDSVKQISIAYLYDPPLHLIDNVETEEVGLPVGYHARIVDYCLAQVALQDDDLNKYQMFLQAFTTGVQSLKDQPEWDYDLYPHISTASRDMGNYYDYFGDYS